MTLRHRLFLVLLGLAAPPIVAVASVVIWQAFRFAEERGREALASRLDTVAELLERRLVAERSYLESLVAESGEGRAAPRGPAIGEWLLAQLQWQGKLGQIPHAFSRALLLEPAGPSAQIIEARWTPFDIAFSAHPIPVDAVPRAYEPLLDGRGRTGAPRWQTVWHPTGAVVALAVPVAPRDEPRAWLVEELGVLDLLQELFVQPGFEALEAGFVAAPLDQGGKWSFVYHTDPTRIGLDAELAGSEATSGPGWSYARSGDTIVARGFHPLTGWVLGGSMSLRAHLAPIRQSVTVMLALFALLLVLVVVAITLETRGLGRVVEEIAETTGAIARGDIERTVAVRRSDEFGAIAEHVNRMARDLVLTTESRSIAGLSARLVHDLKGVASQLNLVIYNLRDRYDDPEFRADALMVMQDLVQQVESLTLRLRRGGEEQEPEWQEFDLDALIRTTVDRRVRAAWPSVTIEERLEARTGVLADAELLGEILDNVLANAVESMEGHGMLRVRSGLARGHGPTHFVEIEDTGPGMDREFIQRELFQPFTTTKPKGIGLGMYQVRKALDRLGGRIEVSSQEQVGTTVRIEVGRRQRRAGEHGDDSRGG